MSEEFYMQVSIELISKRHQQDIEELIEHLELYEKKEAITLINTYKPELMNENFSSSITPFSNYELGDDIIDMYLQCFDENIEGMIIEHVDSPLGMTLAIEGKDNNAADFGSSLLLLLKGMSATKIQATAGTDYWQASWVENVEGMLSITLKEYEE